MVIWPRVAGFLLVGYLGIGKSFAYLGVPPLFIGEIVLGAFLLLKPRVVLGTWVTTLLRPSPLNGFALSLLLFMAYGTWQVARGVFGGSNLIYTFKFFIFNYYALYMFLGMWVGLHSPECLHKLIRVLAWVNGVYSLIYLLALRHVAIQVPGSDWPLFSIPGGGAVAILGLLCFERDLRAVWPVLILNIAVVLVWQVRAEWLCLAVGTLTWGLLTRRLGRMLAIGIAGLAVLGMIGLADVRLVGRAADVSLSETLARAIAPIDLELAKALSPHAADHASTADWRELWWDAIWRSVHSTPMLEAWGHGYAFDLFGLAPDEVRQGQGDWDVRTPHSVFYYALGYTGWVGVVLFAALQLAILRLLWQAFRLDGQPAGVVFWVAFMAMACFEAFFETPYRAIPFYLLSAWPVPRRCGAPASRSCFQRDTIPGLLSIPDRAVTGLANLGEGEALLRSLQFLKAYDVGLRLVEPAQQHPQKAIHPVDVVRGDPHRFGGDAGVSTITPLVLV